jgi:hypothetical protein
MSEYILDISDDVDEFRPKAGNEGRPLEAQISIEIAPLTYAQDSRAIRIATAEAGDDQSRWFDVYVRECIAARVKTIKNLRVRKNGEVKEITDARALYEGHGVLAQIMAEVAQYISQRERVLKKKTPPGLPVGSTEPKAEATLSPEIQSS